MALAGVDQRRVKSIRVRSAPAQSSQVRGVVLGVGIVVAALAASHFIDLPSASACRGKGRGSPARRGTCPPGQSPSSDLPSRFPRHCHVVLVGIAGHVGQREAVMGGEKLTLLEGRLLRKTSDDPASLVAKALAEKVFAAPEPPDIVTVAVVSIPASAAGSCRAGILPDPRPTVRR